MAQDLYFLAGFFFVVAFATSIYPRSCIDRFKQLEQKASGNPNQRITFKMMRQLDEKLFIKFAVWASVSLFFLGGFVFFVLLAVFY